MVKKTALWSFIISISIPLFITAQSTAQYASIDNASTVVKKLTLSECINLARENSPVLMQSKEDIEIARSKLTEARSGYFPKFHVRASYNYFNTNEVIRTPFPQDLVSTLAENAVMSSLRDIALVSGRNPISRSAITELDVLAAVAARNGSTPLNTYNYLTGQAERHIYDQGLNILHTPIHGNLLFRTEVGMRQPIFLWGMVYNLNRQAKEGIKASRSGYKKVENEVVYQVTERYQQVLLAKDGLKLAQETEQKFSTLQDLIEAMYKGEAEKVTKLDFLEVKAYVGLVKAKVAEVQKSLDIAKVALKQSIGLDEAIELDTLDESQTYDYIDVNLHESIQKALINRPEFAELNAGMEAKKHEIKATKAENRPKILLDSAFETNVDNKNYLEPDTVDFRLSVIADVPLFDGLKTFAKVNQKKAELEKFTQVRRQLEQGVTLEVTDTYLGLNEAKQKLLATKEASEAAIENQSLARESFEMEIVDAEKVIKAQLLEAEVRTRYLLSIFNYNILKAKLNKITGNSDSFSSYNSDGGFNPYVEDFAQPAKEDNTLMETKPESIL